MLPAKHIGIASITAEGGALAYREIVHASEHILGRNCHPEISLHSHSFSKFADTSAEDGSWGRLIIESSRKLAAAGAEFFICPANTNHIVYDQVRLEVAIPWIHIAEIVAERAENVGCKRVLLLGTRTLMQSTVYKPFLDARDIEIVLPRSADQEEVHRIIFDELIRGITLSSSRSFAENLVCEYVSQHDCDSVVLGCTELALLFEGLKCSVPVLDSTQLVAHGAIAESLGKSLSDIEALIANKGDGHGE